MNSNKILKIVLLRHGQTVYNIEKRLQSPKDHLTENGKKETVKLVEKIKSFNFDEIISSDERRAVESSEIINNILKIPLQITELIREKSSGDFSDKLVNEVDWSIVGGSFLDKKIPGGDSVREVMVRAAEFFKELNSIEQGKTILVVSHGTFLRILYCIIFNKNIEDHLLNYEFPNSTYIEINRTDDGMWNLVHSPLLKKDNKKNG